VYRADDADVSRRDVTRARKVMALREAVRLRDRRRLRVRALRWACVVLAIAALAIPAVHRWIFAHPITSVVFSIVIASLAARHYVLARSSLGFERRPVPPLAARALALAGGDALGAKLEVSRSGLAAVIGQRVFVRDRLLAILTSRQLLAVFAHELEHWPERSLLVRRLAFGPAIVAIAIAAVTLVDADAGAHWVAAVAFALTAIADRLELATQQEAHASEHTADLAAARCAGVMPWAQALLKIVELTREDWLRDPRRAREVLDCPTFVSWRDYDENGDGELERAELERLLARVQAWPELHVDVRPPSSRGSHPGSIERILFVLRELIELARADHSAVFELGEIATTARVDSGCCVICCAPEMMGLPRSSDCPGRCRCTAGEAQRAS
jgi:Zn-dependent protease with chaperone function